MLSILALGLASFWASWPQLGLWLNPRVKTSNTFLVFRILHGNIEDFFGTLYPSQKSSRLFWYSVSFTEIFKDFFGILYPSRKSSRLFWYSISFTEIFKTFLVFHILHGNLQKGACSGSPQDCLQSRVGILERSNKSTQIVFFYCSLLLIG